MPQRVDFKFMKRLARSKVKSLRGAEPTPRVKKAINALNGSLKLLNDCTGMGFQITARKATTARRARGKRTSR